MQVQIRTNSVEFEFAPNSHKFVEPPEFEFEPKFLELFCNHLEVHPFHPGGPVGGGIILRGGHKGPKKFLRSRNSCETTKMITPSTPVVR